MEAINIGSRREVCWDETLMDTCEGVRVKMHRPEYRNDVLAGRPVRLEITMSDADLYSFRFEKTPDWG